MNKFEIAKLLTTASAVDSRKVEPPMVEAWAVSVADIDYDVAVKALELHWRNSTDWLLPAHIRRLAVPAKELLALESDRLEQQRFLSTLGLTMDDYREHVEEPGWLDEKQREYRALVQLDAAVARQRELDA